MTQAERVLHHLKTKGEIDPIASWSQLGIYRLGARIFDLRAAGHEIEKRTKEVTNRYGETCRVAAYELKQQEAAGDR